MFHVEFPIHVLKKKNTKKTTHLTNRPGCRLQGYKRIGRLGYTKLSAAYPMGQWLACVSSRRSLPPRVDCMDRYVIWSNVQLHQVEMYINWKYTTMQYTFTHRENWGSSEVNVTKYIQKYANIYTCTVTRYIRSKRTLTHNTINRYRTSRYKQVWVYICTRGLVISIKFSFLTYREKLGVI